MSREAPAYNPDRHRINGIVGVRPQACPYLIITSQQNTDQPSVFTITIAGQLNEVCLVLIILLGE